MNTNREEKAWQTQRDMEKIGGEGDERSRMDLGPSATQGSRQTALAFVDEDLMC